MRMTLSKKNFMEIRLGTRVLSFSESNGLKIGKLGTITSLALPCPADKRERYTIGIDWDDGERLIRYHEHTNDIEEVLTLNNKKLGDIEVGEPVRSLSTGYFGRIVDIHKPRHPGSPVDCDNDYMIEIEWSHEHGRHRSLQQHCDLQFVEAW